MKSHVSGKNGTLCIESYNSLSILLQPWSLLSLVQVKTPITDYTAIMSTSSHLSRMKGWIVFWPMFVTQVLPPLWAGNLIYRWEKNQGPEIWSLQCPQKLYCIFWCLRYWKHRYKKSRSNDNINKASKLMCLINWSSNNTWGWSYDGLTWFAKIWVSWDCFEKGVSILSTLIITRFRIDQ